MTNMRIGLPILVALYALITTLVIGALGAQPPAFPPTPKPLPILEKSCVKPSPAEFAKAIDDLRKIREAWETEQKAALKKKAERYWSSEDEQEKLQRKLEAIVRALENRLTEPPAPQYVLPKTIPPKKSKGSPAAKPVDVPPANEPAPAEKSKDENIALAPPDHINLGQAFLRQGAYASALAAFSQVDLKSRTLDERSQLLLLIAMCQLHLGKTKDASAALNQVIQDAIDSRFVDYAQMHLSKARFDSDTEQKLANFRARRLALEKRP